MCPPLVQLQRYVSDHTKKLLRLYGLDVSCTSKAVSMFLLNIDPESSVPIYRQLYTSLRNAILNGQLASGTQLPSTRALASELGFARGTILNAYEQLLAEGYVEGDGRWNLRGA
jgi:regulatory GntR family protein